VAKLGDWLHETCAYTAFVAPWLANTGWGKGGKRDAGGIALSCLLNDQHPRTERFRSAAALVMKSAGLTNPNERELPASKTEVETWVGAFHKDDIGSIITQLRNRAPTHLLGWLDSVGAPRSKDKHLTKDWFPLFAKGGAEGSGNYIVRQQGYLADSFTNKDKPERGRRRLECSLTGDSMPDLLEKSWLSGLFYPGFRGDPNIGQTFDTNTRANPWDFILLMEGLLFFRSATTRRLGDRDGNSSFPFYCDSSLGGSFSIGIREVPESDKSISSGEIWCPLWDSPLNSSVLHGLLGEGRFQVAGRSVKKAAQFALAVSRFGCDRGIKAFLRYGLFRRSGSYGKKDQTAPLAIPLGVFPVTRLPKLSMLEALLDFDDAFGWRSGVHPGSGHNHPSRIVSAWAAYDGARFKAVVSAQSGTGDDDLVNLNTALGNLVREFAVTKGRVRQGRGENAKAPSKPNAPLPPPLDRKWANLEPEQNHAEFNLARAIGSILPWGESAKNPSQPSVGALLTNLLPVARKGQRWAWDELTRSPVWSEGVSVLGNLSAVMHRRLVDAKSGKGDGLPFVSFHPASFTDLWRLWNGELDETRLSELIRAMALVDFGSQRDQSKFDAWQASNDATPNLTQSGVWFDSNDQARLTLRETSGIHADELEAAFALPRAYSLLKLCFIGGHHPAVPAETGTVTRDGREPVPNSPLPLLNLLLAGRSAEALQSAARMLRAKGYPTIVPEQSLISGEWELSPADSQRLAGLLLIPVRRVGVLAALSIKPQPNR
jgi:CRISPR-associated protein Csx17